MHPFHETPISLDPQQRDSMVAFLRSLVIETP